MPKQNPDLLLLKIGDGTPTIVYSILCGLNTRNLTLDGDTIDVTTIPCDGLGSQVWREKMAGISQVSFSGSGFFESKAQSVKLVELKMTGGSIGDFQIAVPALGTFTGKFIIDSLGIAGEVGGGAVTQEMALSSTGAIAFVAEA